jgi:hypothetical protein
MLGLPTLAITQSTFKQRLRQNTKGGNIRNFPPSDYFVCLTADF